MAEEIGFGFINLGAFLFSDLNLRLHSIVNLDYSPKKSMEVKELCKFF